MAKGRNRLPAVVLQLAGSYRASARSEAEVEMAPGALERPDGLLDDIARKWWDKLTTRLCATPGLITPDNAIALALLCQALSTYEQANTIIERGDRQGLLFENDRGDLKRNPALVIREHAHAEIRMGCAQFGLTPADRSGITTAGAAKKRSAADNYLAG